MKELNNLLTVSEVSQITGKSKQYIYKIMSTKLNEFVVMVDNQKMIDKKALTEVFDTKNQPKLNNQPNSTDISQQVVDILREQIQNLQKQLTDQEERHREQLDELRADKDKQIEKQDRQIEELNRALEREQNEVTQAQIVHARDQEKILLLEQKAEEQEQPKKRWWQFNK